MVGEIRKVMEVANTPDWFRFIGGDPSWNVQQYVTPQLFLVD